MQNKSKRSLYGIVCLIIFSCFLLGSEVFVYSFDSLGNVEIDFFTENTSQQPTKQSPDKDSQQTPHKHIVLSHLYSLIDSEAGISLTHPIASAFIPPHYQYNFLTISLTHIYCTTNFPISYYQSYPAPSFKFDLLAIHHRLS